MEMIVIEIDLSQIPSDKIKNFLRKNGNEANVVKLCACKRKQPDPYGSDLTCLHKSKCRRKIVKST